MSKGCYRAVGVRRALKWLARGTGNYNLRHYFISVYNFLLHLSD